MKKILLGLFVLASVASLAGEWNVYGKISGDVYSRFDSLFDGAVGKKGKFAPSVFLEGTKNISPEFELGAGIGYTGRPSYDVDYNDGELTYKGKFPRYNSVPLYLIAKYNFSTDTNLKPYIKVDLGWSFNTRKSFDLTITENATGNKAHIGENWTLNIKNGIYASVGFGVEYNNFIGELSYVHTGAKIYSNFDEKDTTKYRNNAIRLSIGYKFSF